MLGKMPKRTGLNNLQSVKTVADNESRSIDGEKMVQTSYLRRHSRQHAEYRGSCCQYTRHESGIRQRRSPAKSVYQFKSFAPLQAIAAR